MANSKTDWSYVPALDGIVTPPPAAMPEPPSVTEKIDSTGAWFIVTLSIVLVTIVFIAGMVIDGTTVRYAVNQAVKVFLTAMGLVVIVLSGTLTDIVRGWQREKTERQRIATYAELTTKAFDWRLAVEENRKRELQGEMLPDALARRLNNLEYKLAEHSLSADPTQPPTYVAPYDNRPRGAFASEMQAVDTTRQEALRWAMSLYTESGAPDPDKLWLTNKPESHGRLKNTRTIGSARGTGSNEARLWLLHRRVLVKRPGGYALNLQLVPRAEDLRYVE